METAVWVVTPTYNEAANLPSMVHSVLGLEVPPLSLPGRDGHIVETSSDGSKVVPARSQLGVSAASGELPESPLRGQARREGSSGRRARVAMLIVDDSSPDGTGAVADKLAERYPEQVRVLHRPRKMGLASAYVDGFGVALDLGADVVVEMDADFSHSPSYLPMMVGMLGEYDVVVGSRWVPGGQVDATWEPWRYVLSKYANVYARLVTGLRLADSTGGFRAFRADALRQLPLHRIRSHGYVFQTEIGVACQRAGLRVAEIPIYFGDRARGKSKMSALIVVEAMWRVWQIRFGW
ncbi:MAG: glycosyltransferase [Chloroflexi bacterium]|nr:glycosyltransferase [Chloroflexota bacterium]